MTKTIDDAREVEIQAMIAGDPDAPEATDEDIAKAKPFAEAFPELVRRGRGRPALETPRRQISLRLDPDVIKKFKATGKGWQSRINEVLKNAEI